MTHDENVVSKLTVGEAAEICLKFRHDRNVSECICQYLSDVAELEASKHVFFPPSYVRTFLRNENNEMTHDELLECGRCEGRAIRSKVENKRNRTKSV